MTAPTPDPSREVDEREALREEVGSALQAHYSAAAFMVSDKDTADAILPILDRLTAEAADKARREALEEAWDEGAEATYEWVAACSAPTNNGPPDPPRNPYAEPR